MSEHACITKYFAVCYIAHISSRYMHCKYYCIVWAFTQLLLFAFTVSNNIQMIFVYSMQFNEGSKYHQRIPAHAILDLICVLIMQESDLCTHKCIS